MMNQPDQIKRALNFASYFNLALIFSGVLTACDSDVQSSLQPQSQEKTTKTQVLEAGAAMLQTDSPLDPLNIYLDGFHASKTENYYFLNVSEPQIQIA